jgi:hypothetical protein
MCMPMTRRLQLLLDEDQYRRVADVARRQRTSVAAVIREAIDRGLAPSSDRRAKSARAILAAPPMDVPGVDELLDELAELRGRHG